MAANTRDQYGLTQLQRKFADTYRAHKERNATQSYLAVYTRSSLRAAESSSCNLLKHPKVSAYIAMLDERDSRKHQVTAEDIIKSIAQEINFDPGELYNDDGSLKKITDLPEDIRMCLQGVDFAEIAGIEGGTVTKLKWAKKNLAREQAMKHLGMFERDNQQKQPIVHLNIQL